MNRKHHVTTVRVLGVAAAALLTTSMATLVGAPAGAAPTPSTPTPSSPAPSSPSLSAPAGKSLAGKTVFLDPGHQGSSGGRSLSAQVPDGRGGKKDCQTTGATGVNGAKEHTVNWDIAQLVKAGLESQGARVVLSRADDTGWGGCVDERAAAASRSGAAVAVSLHADSTSAGADASKKGFHMIVPTLPIPDATVNKVQSSAGRSASEIMRDAFVKAGFPPANYAGVVNGLQTRSDIAAVNLTKVPAVFIEMGNLSNPTEAASLAGKDGQLKYSMAITNGILNFVKPGAAAAPSVGTGSSDAAPGTTPQGGTTPQAGTTPQTSEDPDAGLASVIPFVQQLLGTKDPAAITQLLLGQGQDVSAQVLKAMLSIMYGLFGGKLPIG